MVTLRDFYGWILMTNVISASIEMILVFYVSFATVVYHIH